MSAINIALHSNETLMQLSQKHFKLLSHAIDLNEQESWISTMEDLLCELNLRGVRMKLIQDDKGDL